MSAVVAVACSAEHRFSKQVQGQIRLIAGEGVEGDAHRGATAQHLYMVRLDPTQPNLAQVHLFSAEMLEELTAKGFAVNPGDLGENILTRGIDLLALPLGTRLRLGAEAVLEITGLRTPCGQIDHYQAGLQDQLWGKPDALGNRARRGGVMSIVRAGGVVAPGDAIRIDLPPEPHIALGPV